MDPPGATRKANVRDIARFGRAAVLTTASAWLVLRAVGTVTSVKVQRHTEIVARVRADGTVSVADLSTALDVSRSTIRRDLHQLDRAGVLTRVHGGAALVAHLVDGPDSGRPFADVARAHTPEKAAVARAAAARVRDGEVVALDIGTTTALLARELRGRAITVVTNSLAVLDELRHDDAVELILLGGLVRRSYHSLVGVLTEDAVGQVGVDRAFIGTSGIGPGAHVMDTTFVEVPVKRALIAAAREVVALDIGTTTALLARELRGRAITVVTNSLAVLDELRHDDAVELILLGGLVRRSYHSLVGVLTEDAVGQVGVDRAFLGTSGIGPGGQVMDTTFVEVPVKRALITAAREVVVVADGHKIPGSGTMRVCVGDDVDVLVTTADADPAILEQCRHRGILVVLA